jgi:adenylate cyclase
VRLRRQRTRLWLLLAAGLVAAAVGLTVQATDALRRLELATVDARFAVRGDEPAPSSVAVVGIDAQTLRELNIRWPFPRTVHARVIDRLRAAGAKVIAYDVQFSELTTEAADLALYDAIDRAGNVVLGTSETDADGTPALVFAPAALREAGATAGNANFETDPGGTIRRMPYRLDGLVSFPVAAARMAGAPAPPGRFNDRTGAWIDYPGPDVTLDTLSFVDVLRGRVPASKLRGRVVVVGATAPTLKDVFPTSVSGLMPGPEIQANAIATILRGFPLRPAAPAVNAVLILLAAFLVPAASFRLVGLRSLIAPLVVLGGLLIGSQLAFDAGWIVAVVTPVLALALATVGSLAVNYSTEIRERNRVRAVFSRFVPAQVADQVIARTDDDLRLGGERTEGTVMFCDLRGFTTWAESVEAEQVIELLNRYLTEMSDAILAHGGTVVSYMGDGIMAVFGAPIEQPDHADRAVAAAREMLWTRLPAFNTGVRASGAAEGFHMGIGLCTGPFMSGNVGSEQRLEYTAVGDTTNTASRLEGMTKGTPHDVFISDATRLALRDGDAGLVEVGELEVRGRRAPMRVWTLTPEAGAGNRPTPGPRPSAAPPPPAR